MRILTSQSYCIYPCIIFFYITTVIMFIYTHTNIFIFILENKRNLRNILRYFLLYLRLQSNFAKNYEKIKLWNIPNNEKEMND